VNEGKKKGRGHLSPSPSYSSLHSRRSSLRSAPYLGVDLPNKPRTILVAPLVVSHPPGLLVR
jgi:hypothetical protein